LGPSRQSQTPYKQQMCIIHDKQTLVSSLEMSPSKAAVDKQHSARQGALF
jgi:hypothetical protein